MMWYKKSRGCSKKEIDDRKRAQLSVEEKKSRADIVINNNGELVDLYQKARDFYINCVLT